MTTDDRPIELGLLDVLVGSWTQRITGHGDPVGTMAFEWTLDSRYLLQRSNLPAPFPDSWAMIEWNAFAGEFRQHYFDSRGVSRIYRMTVVGPEWKLLRLEPDFSPLDFAQQFIGVIQPDERRIEGHWDRLNEDGTEWELDFGVSFERQP